MSKLLIQESPLTFQPSLAVAIGINEAIVLQQVHYWINNPKNKGYEQDGFKWVYNTYAEWKETNFPFWSEATIQRTFSNLEDAGLILSIQPMKGKYDRTKYYRIDYVKLDMFDDSKLIRSDDSKLICSLDESEITAENTKDSFETLLSFEKMKAGKEEQAWNGRETFAPQDYPLVDWYHKVTGQDCPKSKSKDWHKAIVMWSNNNLTVKDLQAAYDMDIKWRGVFTSPNQLTDKAIALKAQPRKPDELQRNSMIRTIGQ